MKCSLIFNNMARKGVSLGANQVKKVKKAMRGASRVWLSCTYQCGGFYCSWYEADQWTEFLLEIDELRTSCKASGTMLVMAIAGYEIEIYSDEKMLLSLSAGTT